MNYSFHFEAVWRAREALAWAAVTTLELTVLSMVIGTALAVPLALLKQGGPRGARQLASSWIEVARNTPCLFQIYLFYFGLGAFGIHLSAYISVLAALSFNNAGYMAEIVRGGLRAISVNQGRAAHSLGMSATQTYLHVILPQLFRVIFHPASNQLMWALLNSSLGMMIGLHELTGETAFQQSMTFRPFEFYAVAALAYYVMAKAIILTSRGLGARLFRY
jgi:His/Glu/Gln/Arg/opine family amino acid ABC transporter permease subunit